MRRVRLPALGLAAVCVLALLLVLTGCATSDTVSEEPQITQDEQDATDLMSDVTSQAADLCGQPRVALREIPHASMWLGGEGLVAYADMLMYGEFIVDTDDGTLRSFLAGTRTYQDPLDLASYEGEPTRDEVLQLADEWVRDNAPEYDMAHMRRTAVRHVLEVTGGEDSLQYSVHYSSYRDGVRLPEDIRVAVSLGSEAGTPWVAGLKNPGARRDWGIAPKISMQEAIGIATGAAVVSTSTVERAELLLREDGLLVWSLELGAISPRADGVTPRAAWQVDAIKGDIVLPVW